MSDYTPTAEEVRGAASRGVTGEGFDRWLTEHDRRKSERVWEEARGAWECALGETTNTDFRLAPENPYLKEARN